MVLLSVIRIARKHLNRMTSTWKAPVLSPRKVIFDTDAGVDDAHALLILDGASPDDIELLGLTCVAGNVKLPQALKNMSHILEHCSFPQVSDDDRTVKLFRLNFLADILVNMN